MLERNEALVDEQAENKKVNQKRRTRRIKNLIFVCTVTAIVLVASTYAWFIGMQEVNVDTFEVEIAAADSLLLSLDGSDWKKTIKFTEKELTDHTATATDETTAITYENHKNNWPEKGLVPLSTVGEMDSTVSEMMLYEKGGLKTTWGGYRLIASRVNNYNKEEIDPAIELQKGYVAFDLFIKNYSGSQYIEQLNPDDEEDIYLTTDSVVKVAESGGVVGSGIENSVRVAFAQIGRVNQFNSNQTDITSLTCNDSGTSGTISFQTGICRTAQIWEPNDTYHVDGAISFYQTSCLKRKPDGHDLKDYNSYYGYDADKQTLSEEERKAHACGEVVDGTTYDTYAIKEEVGSQDFVDIYDGPAYNGYDVDEEGKLIAVNYFTDTEKSFKGTLRPTFMTLAPNSITKVRVYVYIEGQDIDNYDFASVGKKIAVNFGFSKERLSTEDIEYTGPQLEDEVYPNPEDTQTKPENN